MQQNTSQINEISNDRTAGNARILSLGAEVVKLRTIPQMPLYDGDCAAIW
jgi:hypothetical protein